MSDKLCWFIGVLLFLAGSISSLSQAQATIPDFNEAIPITDTEKASVLARNPLGSIQYDANGQLHLVYTEENTEGTGLGSPGIMLYQIYDGQSWREPLPIREEMGEGIPFTSGGNPALLVDETNSIHFTWHDYRHSTSDSGTNQVEVYYRRLNSDGSLEPEVRISDNTGNSWRPKISQSQNGQLAIGWYDFSTNSVGDLLVAFSDENQQFNANGEFSEQFIGGANPQGNSLLLPQIGFDRENRLHATWTLAELSGFFFQNERLFYGLLDTPDSRELSQVQEITPQGTSSTDPAKFVFDSNDTLWMVWTNKQTPIPNIMLASKTSTQTIFSEPIPISNNDVPDAVEQANVATAPDGSVYVVWTDFRTGEGDLYMRRYDPASQSLSDILQLTTDDFDPDEHAVLEISDSYEIALIWEKEVEGRRNLMMRTARGESVAVTDWWMFE